MNQHSALEARLARIRSVLGQPSWQRGNVLLYCGDSLDLMSKLPDGLFDLTITSPPYNIGKEYERRIPLEQYLTWSEEWMGQVARLTGPSGAFWLNLGYIRVPDRGRAVPLAYLLWSRTDLFLLQEKALPYAQSRTSARLLSRDFGLGSSMLAQRNP